MLPLKHRVVVTGIGLVTPLGNGAVTTWQAVVNGKSGITTIPDHFNLADYPVKVAGRVTEEQSLLDAIIPPRQQSKMDRFIQLGLLAGYQAMSDAGFSINNPEDRKRFGVFLGVGFGGLASISQAVCDLQEGGPKKVSPFSIPKAVSNLGPAWLSMQWNLQGPVMAIANACASGADAIGLAFRQIRDGYADYMLAGGSESCITPIGIVSFGNMRALSSWSGDPAAASKPFDRQRSGFVMAEGAAIMILERADRAQERNAHIYAEIVGYGASSDAHHITAMHPEGEGAARAIQAALDDAGITPSQIGYVNAHGTSTAINDTIETLALKKVFGSLIDPKNPSHILVSSTKSMTGHMLGAAGAVEAIFTALALKHQIIPPTINLHEPDPVCDLDYVPHVARKHHAAYAISNSFGFGGGNVVLALKRA